MMILAPSMLSADFKVLGEELKTTEDNGAKYIHYDVMDGMFVPNLSFGPGILKSIRPASTMVHDVHLMIEEPIRYIETFAKSSADIITVHIEACEDLDATIAKIREYGCKVGVLVACHGFAGEGLHQVQFGLGALNALHVDILLKNVSHR